MIILREPKSEFSLLPKIKEKSRENQKILLLEKSKITETESLQDLDINDDSSYNNFFSLSEKSYKIACIDDSPIILKSLSAFLNRDNITVFPIANAAKAMMLLNNVKPDLIFMDVNMPLIDGYQLCSLLRKNNNFKDIPIIMLTGNKGFIDRTKAKMSGATDYMTKPFKQDDLLKIIFRYLSDN
jgi:twitching motility two-component system response regulator PilG